MKKHVFARVLGVLVVLVGWQTTLVYSAAPPLTEEFLDSTLPGVPFSFKSSTEGRIELEVDETDLQSESVPSGWFVVRSCWQLPLRHPRRGQSGGPGRQLGFPSPQNFTFLIGAFLPLIFEKPRRDAIIFNRFA